MVARLGAFVAILIAGLAVLVLTTRGDEVDEAEVLAEQVIATQPPTPTATPTPVGPTPTPTPEPPRVINVAFSGDLLSHGGVIAQAQANATEAGSGLAYDYSPMFSEVAPTISSADLAICHQETPLSADNTALSGYPIFNAPGDLADGIASAGWDACSVASNHALDKGFAGVTATLDELDRAGVGHAGTARTEEEAATPVIYEVGGVAVGHLSYTYGTNGIPVPAEAPWAVNVTTVEAVLDDAAELRAAGADVVVLSIQWGNEYQQSPSGVQSEQAAAFLGSPDIDLIIGAHVHVIQPVDVIDGEVVLYGLGNFLSNQSPQSCDSCPAGTEDGMIFTVEITEIAPGEFATTRVQVTPTWVDRSDYTVVPVAVALAEPDLDPDRAARLTASYERTVAAVTALDAPTDVVTFDPLPAP